MLTSSQIEKFSIREPGNNQNPLRILEVSLLSPASSNGGGVEAYIKLISKMFEKNGFQVYFAYIGEQHSAENARAGDIVVNNRLLFALPFLKRIIYNLTLKKSIKFSNFHYDVIHINGDNGALLAGLPGTISLTTLHGSWLQTAKKTLKFSKFPSRLYNISYSILLGWLESFAVKRSHLIIAVSRFVSNYFQSQRKDLKIKVIHSFSKEVGLVDHNKRMEIRGKLGLSPDDIICLWVGRDPVRKRLDVAVASVLQTEKMKLLVVGTPYISKNHRIIPLGMVDENQLVEIYNASDIFLFPSVAEGFSLALIEAMSAGLVPIVARGNPSEEIIKHGNNGLIANCHESFSKLLRECESEQGALEKLKENSRKTALSIKISFTDEMHKIMTELRSMVDSL